MRWILGITALVVLGIIGWFWYPRLFPKQEATLEQCLPHDLWLLIEIDENSDLKSCTDSNSFLASLPFFSSWPLPDSLAQGDTLYLFAYGNQENTSMGVISNFPMSNVASLEQQDIIGKYHRSSTSAIEQEIQHPHQVSKHLKDKRQVGSMKILALPHALILQFADAMKPALYNMFADLHDMDSWLLFEISDQGKLFRASGIASSMEADNLVSNDLRLWRYLPSHTALALSAISNGMPYTLAYCNYPGSTAPYHNVFLLFENPDSDSVQTEAVQQYQGIPVSIGKVPPALDSLHLPWSDEAYTAHIGSATILASDADRLLRLVNDFLSDDKLISSEYYKGLQPSISDAAFTLYLRPDKLPDENPFLQTSSLKLAGNSLIFQTMNGLSERQFFAITAMHHQLIDEGLTPESAVMLEASITGGPWPFNNHLNGKGELIVQDENNKLYLIDGEGNILWSKSLSGPVAGTPQIVDIYDNKKFQLLLIAGKELHLLDRNGKQVESFPLKLNDTGINPPTFVRYSRKDEPRILVTDGAVVRNFTVEGKEVKGWLNPTLNETCTSPVSHVLYKGLDYLVVTTEDNKAHVFDRQGKERQKAVQCDTAATEITFIPGQDWNGSAFAGSDENGVVYVHYSNGRSENFKPVDGDVSALHINAASSTYRYAVITPEKIVALNAGRQTSLELLVPFTPAKAVHLARGNKPWMALYDELGNEIYVIDAEAGVLLKNRAFKGSEHMLLSDLNRDGTYELITTNGGKQLLTYRLD